MIAGIESTRIQDLTGRRFGRLIVMSFSHRRPKPKGGGIMLWNCLCDCGRSVVVIGNCLKTGNTTSCGCVHREGVAARNFIHGGAGSRLFKIWCGMIKRCENPKCINFRHYGARGIRLCEQWRYNFAAFRTWALCNGYADNLTIDRIKNDGNYEPGNCQWLTRAQNASKMNRDRRDRT